MGQKKIAGEVLYSANLFFAALSIPVSHTGSDPFSYYLMNRISAVVFKSML
jgi:hypothetical protein